MSLPSQGGLTALTPLGVPAFKIILSRSGPLVAVSCKCVPVATIGISKLAFDIANMYMLFMPNT